MASYIHQTAGSTCIMPDGKVLRFMGPPGKSGTYSTDNPAEIEQLDKLSKNPQVPMEKLPDVVDVVATEITKPADPAIAQSVADAAANSALYVDPEVAKARDGLAALLARS